MNWYMRWNIREKEILTLNLHQCIWENMAARKGGLYQGLHTNTIINTILDTNCWAKPIPILYPISIHNLSLVKLSLSLCKRIIYTHKDGKHGKWSKYLNLLVIYFYVISLHLIAALPVKLWYWSCISLNRIECKNF
jgi:hypothetical protein